MLGLASLSRELDFAFKEGVLLSEQPAARQPQGVAILCDKEGGVVSVARLLSWTPALPPPHGHSVRESQGVKEMKEAPLCLGLSTDGDPVTSGHDLLHPVQLEA